MSTVTPIKRSSRKATAAKPAPRKAAAKEAAKVAKAPAKATAAKVEQEVLTTGERRLEAAYKAVTGISDPLTQMAAMTELVAEARDLISRLSDDRTALCAKAKARGISYTDLGKAAGISAGRMAQIASGRPSYVRVGDR